MTKLTHILLLLLLPIWASAQTFTGGNGDGFAVFSVNSQTIPACEDLAGEVNPDAEVCVGASTGTLTVINFSGNVVRWEWRVERGAWSDIAITTETYSEVPSSIGSWDYRAVIETAECGEMPSDYVTIIVNPLPDDAGDISGQAEVCQGESSVLYSMPAVAEATSYDWAYSGTGATINGTSNSVTIDFTAGATSGNLTVKATNDCGEGAISADYPITVNPLPDAAGTITGSSEVCKGASAISYTISAIAEATSYEWVYSGTGATINGAGNGVTIDFTGDATSGNLTVKGVNACGDGLVSADYAITVNPLPNAAGTINGPALVCKGAPAQSYSVPAIAEATSYDWSYSGAGATINGSGNEVTIDFSASATSGNLTVKGVNDCGDGAVSSDYSITINDIPDAAGAIAGASTVCLGESDISYSITEISNATSYLWSYSGEGATINGTGNSVTLDFSASATSGDLTVKATNDCGDGAVSDAYSVNVIQTVGAAGAISGDSELCQGSEEQSYSVPEIVSADSYLWTIPEGAHGSSTTNSISIEFDNDAVSGDLKVKGLNTCGEGAESKLSLTIIDAVYPEIRAKWGDILICYNLGDSLQAYQWYKDGVEIQGASGQFYQTHKEPGSYFVVTTDEFGCSNMSNTIDIKLASAYLLYPNPTSSNTEVNVVDEETGKLTITIIDAAGLLVRSFNEIKNDVEFTGQLNLSDMQPGIYTVEFKIEGLYRKYEKLIILE